MLPKDIHPLPGWGIRASPHAQLKSCAALVETPHSSRCWGAACARGGLAEAVSLSRHPRDGASDGDTLSLFPATPKPGWILPTEGTAYRKQVPRFTPPDACLPQTTGGEPGKLGGFGPVQDQGPRDLSQQTAVRLRGRVSGTPPLTRAWACGCVGWLWGLPTWTRILFEHCWTWCLEQRQGKNPVWPHAVVAKGVSSWDT